MSSADVLIQMPWKHSVQNLNTCGGKRMPQGTQMIIKNCSANPVIENCMLSLEDYGIFRKLLEAAKIKKINRARTEV